jgi:translation initiation factor 3 subunit G
MLEPFPIRWSEYEDMLDNLPPEKLNDPNLDFKVRVINGLNATGKKIRTVELVEVRTYEEVVPKEVIERQKRLKNVRFGNANATLSLAGEEGWNESITSVSRDPVEIEMLIGKDKNPKLDKVEQKELGEVTNIKCRKCGENHWTRECKKDVVVSDGLFGGPMVNGNGNGTGTRSDIYVAPGVRDKSIGGGRGESQSEMEWKVRLSNLPDNSTEDDLRELLDPVGKVKRVHLARDRQTSESRGFAYVSFYQEGDMKAVLDKFEGYRYEYMVLHVEVVTK